VEIGFTLSSEEQGPKDLVHLARAAEEAGFSFATISDHFHPWTSQQGNSPFVWSVLGAIAGATSQIRVGTVVTCPLIRIQPAIVAQAAATVTEMMPGRFFLGVGTGENLNEHVTGQRWPSANERRELLKEAIAVIRSLWAGGLVEHRGPGYQVIDAQLFTLPAEPPPIYVAAAGRIAAEFAAELGDGLIGTAPEQDLVASFVEHGGSTKPKLGQLTVCWAPNERTALDTAMRWWPTAAVKGELMQELPLPRHFEQATEMVTRDQLKEVVVCGPDASRYLEAIGTYEVAGYDHIFIHQIGPDQDKGLEFLAEEVLPELKQREASRKASWRDPVPMKGEGRLPDKRPSVKNERQYEALKDKGMSKERAARIANSPGASSRGGKKSRSGGNSKQGGTTAQKKAAGRKGGKASAQKRSS
jgi:coenzyme F420-dependent glucose-6-phosphate dehydrogenase